MDMYGFYTGRVFDAYEHQGAHVMDGGVRFTTFAPAAARISLIGDFNDWNETPMNAVHDGNFYECYIAQAQTGMRYKYRIYKNDGSFTDHCDPYGFGMELRPQNASVIRDLREYEFHDEKWLRGRSDHRQEPLNIYEIHLGSWKNNEADEHGWYSYRAIADQLIPYVKDNGYNYIEFLPLSEHPCDESWGYQNTGFFAPTSRYGTAAELMELVDICHQNGIGVIMDFVPVHFAVDGYALANYDGTPLYEYPHPAVSRSEWGSCNFIHSRGEVRSFLQSAACYWLKEYHFDGIRVDAISNIIYWQGDSNRGVNHNAVDFIKCMNQGLKERFPDCILCAEDSTNYPKVTEPVWAGGLGFDYKWDMGFMNDTLDYFRLPPDERTANYHKLTFSMMYYYDEKFLLPLSHDEVVHGKATILQKMNGQYEEKFPQARAFYMYMYAHPGKKLNFMGNEFGQLREWDEKREQDWDILRYPLHDAFHRFMQTLHQLYMKMPALYQLDFDRQGFAWLDCHQEERCIYAFMRSGHNQAENLIAVFNFSAQDCQEFPLYVGEHKKLTLLLDSDHDIYGGRKTYGDSSGRQHKNETLCTDELNFANININAFSGKYYLLEERE